MGCDTCIPFMAKHLMSLSLRKLTNWPLRDTAPLIQAEQCDAREREKLAG